ADHNLVYMTLFISQLVGEMHDRKPATKAAAQQLGFKISHGHFSSPGSAGFPLSGWFHGDDSAKDTTSWHDYFEAAREETAKRLVDIVYSSGSADPHWLGMGVYQFIGKTLK
ncbi:actin-related protein 2/3 complex subunit 3, partial [Kipferlia bialata]